MKTWINSMSRIAGDLLFQGGYVTSPTMLLAGGSSETGNGVQGEIDVCGHRRVPAESKGPVAREPRFSVG